VFFGGISIIAAVILIILIGWIIGEYVPMHRTVLDVNDVKFNMSYYIDTLKIAAMDQGTSKIQMLASSVTQQMTQDELIRQAAEKLSVTVRDEEVKNTLENIGIPVSDGSKGLIGGQLLQNKLKTEYFGAQVPESTEQVHALAMFLESESQTLEIRDRLLSGDNFTALAGEFALDYYAKNINQGDYGWHPESIYEVQLGSSVAIGYAFNAEPGVLSEPLFDEDKSKQLGYWLIRVNDIPEEGSANVSAVFLSSEDEAREIKERLEAGEDLGPIADEYSDYSLSRDKHGELGFVMPEQTGETFDAYVFDPQVELGVWCEPIRDERYWSKGGYWLLEVVDREEDREISSEDRNYLIQQLFDNWLAEVQADLNNIVDNTYLTEESKQWAIERVLKDFPEAEG